MQSLYESAIPVPEDTISVMKNVFFHPLFSSQFSRTLNAVISICIPPSITTNLSSCASSSVLMCFSFVAIAYNGWSFVTIGVYPGLTCCVAETMTFIVCKIVDTEYGNSPWILEEVRPMLFYTLYPLWLFDSMKRSPRYILIQPLWHSLTTFFH